MYQKLKNRGIHHACLRIPNLEETKEFYKNTFDAQVVCEWGTDENEDHAFIMDLGVGDFLEIFGCSTLFETGKWQQVAIVTDNIEETFERALANGAKPHVYPDTAHIPCADGSTASMKYALVYAPGGELIEMIQDL